MNPKDRCGTCDGEKVVKKVQVLEVHVDRGAKEGTKITFREAADQAPDMETGDIVVILSERPDPDRDGSEGKDGEEGGDTDAKPKSKSEDKKSKRVPLKRAEAIKPNFKRLQNGVDLVMEHTLTLTEALMGFEFAIRHLDNRIVIVRSPPRTVTSPNDIIYVEGEGMPVLRRASKGDLYIKISIEFPTVNDMGDDAKREALRKLLPPAPQLPEDAQKELKEKSENVEAHEAMIFDDAAAQAKQARDRERAQLEAHEEDDDHHHGHPGASCRAS